MRWRGTLTLTMDSDPYPKPTGAGLDLPPPPKDHARHHLKYEPLRPSQAKASAWDGMKRIVLGPVGS